MAPKDPDVLLCINNRQFILEALKEEDIRIDLRGPFDAREVAYRFGPKDGVCEVSLGKTRVLAVTSAKLEPPGGGRSNEGSVTINVEFSPMASPNFEPGRPGEEASELAVVLERAIRETGAVDVESLCVLAGRRVWNIRVDVHVLDACGNIAGAASLAANASLLSFRRPEATVDPSTQLVTVHPADAREPIPLALHHLPIAVKFGFFAEHEGLLIVDPLVDEEAVMASSLIVVLNAHGELCAVQKGGGVGVPANEIMRCVRIADKMTKELTTQLREEHKKWEGERDKRRVRRHYGAEAAASLGDFGLPGRKDHLTTKTEDDGGDDVMEVEEDDSDSDSDEDEDVNAREAHAPVGVLAPTGSDEDESESEEEEDDESEEEEEEEEVVDAKKRGGKKGKAATDDGDDGGDDDVLGMFDVAAKKTTAKTKPKRTKLKSWDDLPGDGDDLAAAITAKVSSKKKKKEKKTGAANG